MTSNSERAIHQRLDVGRPYGTGDATDIRKLLEGRGAETNGYAIVDLQEDGTIYVHGFRKQREHLLSVALLNR